MMQRLVTFSTEETFCRDELCRVSVHFRIGVNTNNEALIDAAMYISSSPVEMSHNSTSQMY